MDATFIRHVQAYTARYSVSASAARGQRSPGLVAAARDHLRDVRLRAFAARAQAPFQRALDRETQLLMRALPGGGRSWGLARKLLNIFLRNALYTSYLRDHFGLAVAERWFEVPLDSIVALRLRRELPGASTPRWTAVKRLTPVNSTAFQAACRELARGHGVAPVHLDALYWGGDRQVAP